jgi:flagellar motor switch protein FliN
MDSNTNDQETAPETAEHNAAQSSNSDQEQAAEKVEASPVELSSIEESAQHVKPPDEAMNMKMILDLPVDIQAELGHTQMSIREILKLGQGSVIQLDRSAGSSADIIVNGKLIGQGDVVVVDENFGIRITKLISPEERLDSL